MWQPEPGWLLVPGGTGTSTVGVWRTVRDDRPGRRQAALGALRARPSRAERPAPLRLLAARGRRGPVRCGDHDPRPAGAARRRRRGGRRGDHARAGLGRGRRQQRPVRRARDGPLRRRRARRPAAGWPRGQLRDRMDRVARRGGWTTLARTTVADVADHLWGRRRSCSTPSTPCPRCRSTATRCPRTSRDVRPTTSSRSTGGPSAADPSAPTSATTCCRRARTSSRCSTPTCSACPTGSPSREEVALGARVTAVYTVLTRADWALARVAGGEGALASKYRHPSVAPYLRALQRQGPQIEALLA